MPKIHLNAASKLTIGIFVNSTSALFGITKFLREHTTEVPTEQVVFFVPEHTVLCSQLSSTLQKYSSKQSIATIGTPTKDFIDDLLTQAGSIPVNLMLDDAHPEYYLYIDAKYSGTITVNYFTTGDTPYTNSKEMSTEAKWTDLKNTYAALSITTSTDVFESFESHKDTLILPHLLAISAQNPVYYIQHLDILKNSVKNIPAAYLNALFPAEPTLIKEMDLENEIAELRKTAEMSKALDSFLGISTILAGYAALRKPLLFITGTNPFDKYYGFTVFTKLMLQINETYSPKYTIIFFPNPLSCPIQQLTTYQTMLAAGIQIYPPTLATPPIALLMQSSDCYFGGWWDPLYYTVSPKRVLLFAGDPTAISDGNAAVLGSNYFSSSEIITPAVPTTEEDWWKPWRIGAVAGATALLLIILLFSTFCLICREKHKNEEAYVLEDAPDMGNTTGTVI